MAISLAHVSCRKSAASSSAHSARNTRVSATAATSSSLCCVGSTRKPQPNSPKTSVRSCARKRSFPANTSTCKLSASFGLATYPEDGNDLHSIIRAADTMMYKAKADGRDCLAVADPTKPQAFVSPKTSRHS